MRVKDLMTRDVRTITPEKTLGDASEMMRIRGIRHLVVMNGANLAGVISNRDLAAISRRELEQVLVRDVMLDHVITIEPEATVAHAANRMCAHGVGSLPVVDENNKLAGIITTTDLLAYLGRGNARPRPAHRKRPTA